MTNKVITSIAESKNVTSAQVLLRWALQRGVAVIPKSMHQDRVASNIDLFSFRLTESEMNTIDRLGDGASDRLFNPPFRPRGAKVFGDDEAFVKMRPISAHRGGEL